MKKRYFIWIVLSWLGGNLFGQEKASKVLIELRSPRDLEVLGKMGLDVHEGVHHPGRSFETILLSDELTRLSNSGMPYRVLVEDMQKWYMAHRDEEVEARSGPCEEAPVYLSYETPRQFKLGSLGGYLSFSEMKDELMLMHSSYPDFTSTLQEIEGYTSIEGRPIHGFKITSPGGKKDKKQVLYTALHHAREPGSMLQLIYFMWYVLERYPKDDAIRTLLDNVELYFIPCVNPDGFLYNEQKNPTGGGYWRKNRRRINGQVFGVDLNRNYPFQWGLDERGSSSDSTSGIYRGSAPMSEPETQAVVEFCRQHRFEVALNAHTFSALLIYPWGYTYALSPDSVAFDFMGQSLSKENQYTHGNSRIIYQVNGEADDWMYADTSKPKIYSMTPEVGRNGFWAPKSVLIPDCKAMLWTNIGAGLTPLPLAHFVPEEDQITDSPQASFRYTLLNAGLERGNFKINFTPLTHNISLKTTRDFKMLDASDSDKGTCAFEVLPGTPDGDPIEIEVSIHNGYYEQKYIWNSTFIAARPLLIEDFSTLDRWVSSSSEVWGLTEDTYTSSAYSLTDSPRGLYSTDSSFMVEILTKPGLIDLPDNIATLLWTFRAKWFFPRSPDGIVEPILYVDGERQYGICGRYTKPPYGLSDDYSYYGYQEQWVTEQIDLSDFVQGGEDIRIGFRFVSYAGAVPYDGMYIDDLHLYAARGQGLEVEDRPAGSSGFALSPNPASVSAAISCAHCADGEHWSVRNVMGHLLYSGDRPEKLEVASWPAGVYFVTRQAGNGRNYTERVVVTH